MRTIEYINKNSITDLIDNFNIKTRSYHDENLIVLNYQQIYSPKYHPIVRECRGLIIDTERMVPVSRSFDRFYNINEWVDDPFDFDSDYIVEEKADGSLMSVYWHNNQWNIASRGTAFAESPIVSEKNLTLRDVFLVAIRKSLDDFMKGMKTNQCYIFELCSLQNKIVKLYHEPTVYLLDVKIVDFGESLPYYDVDSYAKLLNVKRPKRYNYSCIDDIVNSFDEMDTTEEGYVIIDSQYNRIKIKNPAYVDLHHLKCNGGITPKRITNVIFRGECEEVLSYFPEYKIYFDPYQKAYDNLIESINNKWNELCCLDITQKEYAVLIKDLPYKSILFSLRNGLTLKESFDNMSISTKIGLIETIRRNYE